MELRLIEQACGCSTVVRGGGECKLAKCVPVSAAGTPVESACRQAPGTCRMVCLYNGNRHQAPTDRVDRCLVASTLHPNVSGKKRAPHL